LGINDACDDGASSFNGVRFRRRGQCLGVRILVLELAVPSILLAMCSKFYDPHRLKHALEYHLVLSKIYGGASVIFYAYAFFID
jgi:hypothetical protein